MRKDRTLDETEIINLVFITVVVTCSLLLLATIWIVVCLCASLVKLGFIRDECNRLATGYAKAIASSTAIGIAQEAMGLAVYICDETGACTDANYELCKLFGQGKKDMLGYGWLNSIDANDQQRVKRNWLRSIALGSAYFDDYSVNGIPCRTRAYRMQAGTETLYYVGVVERA